MRRLDWCWLYLTMLCASSSPIHAAEQRDVRGTRVGAPLPALTSELGGSVRLDLTEVSLRGDELSTRLSIHVDEPDAALLLEIPVSPSMGPSEMYPDRYFPELGFSIDDRTIVPEDGFVALAGNGSANVTSLLKMAGVDPWTITRTPAIVSPLPDKPRFLTGLLKFGAVARSGDEYRAKWTARRVVRIPLGSAGHHWVGMTYRARPSRSLLTLDQVVTTLREKMYCVSPRSLNGLSATAPAGDSLFVNEYSIETTIDAKSAGATFEFSPAEGASPRYVFFCGPHGKAVAQRGSIKRRPAELDPAGVMHVLVVMRD